jgi:hypothetical protein
VPERILLFTDQGEIGSADFPERVVVIGERLRLRPLDTFDGKRYDRWGRRLTALVDLPELKAESISELFGFHSEFVPNGGSVTFQLSNDGGVTFYRWDGASWTDDGQFSTREEIDQGFPLLELPSPKRLLVRAKIEPEPGGRHGPEIRSVSLYYELDYQWEEDLLRSLKRQLDAELTYAGITLAALDGQAQVAVDPPVVPKLPVRAFNLTDDPKRLVNLATGISGQDVLLSGPQVGQVEVRFRCAPPVYISADESLEISSSNGVVLEVLSLSENRNVRVHEPKVDWRRAEKKVRIRPQAVQEEAELRIQAQSPLKREAEAMVEALATVLQYDRTFVSEATGEVFIVKGFSPINVGDVIGEGLYVREATLRVTGRHWLARKFEEVPLAEEVKIQTTIVPGGADRTGEETKI